MSRLAWDLGLYAVAPACIYAAWLAAGACDRVAAANSRRRARGGS